MLSLNTLAAAFLAVDGILLSSLLFVFFSPRPLSFAYRTRLLRIALLGSGAFGLVALAQSHAPYLFQICLGANAGLLGVAIFLFCYPKRSVDRRRDFEWLQGYVAKLESELAERRNIERELAFMASVTERDPNCVIELDQEGRMGYRNAAADEIFPDLMAKGSSHPVMAGLQDVIAMIKRDHKQSVRRPFRYGDNVFEQQITWSESQGKACLYMTDVTKWNELDELKTQLLNTVSHEFRTPLSSILATTRLIETEMLGPVSADQKKMLSMTSASATRLNRMITDLLDLSKMEAGKVDLHLEQVDVAALLENVALSFGPLAAEQGIELIQDVGTEPMDCLADPDKLVQVLTNLTSNALKFTKEGKITLSARRQTGEICFFVRDTGIGIPADKLDRVFSKFEQFGAAVRGEKGTGLGLSLCKKLVELHGGTILVESVQGEGTTFSFTLPLVGVLTSFLQSLHRLYEDAARAGQCLSAFILQLENVIPLQPYGDMESLAKPLEALVRERVKENSDLVLRDGVRVYFIIKGVDKREAKRLVDGIIAEFIPLAGAAGALERVAVRANYTSLPEDGTLLEQLQEQLAA